MIECYTWITDNGYKPRMMLEETGLPHKIIPVNIREKKQMEPDFMKLSPGHKIPAIVDTDGPGGARVTLCESGAIFKYLGEKSGKFYPADPVKRVKVDQWLFYGSATFTTLSQQFGHWVIRSPIKAPPAADHYTANMRDMLGILDRHLAAARIRRRRLFDRRHDDVFRCPSSRRQGHRARRLFKPETLARCDRSAARHPAGLGAVRLRKED